MPRHNTIRENSVERNLVRAMGDLGLGTYKFIPDQRVGMPDRVVTLPDGRVIWVELKTRGGQLSVVQQLRHTELQRQGQRVVTVWSKEDVSKLADELRAEYGIPT